ncbi:MAG: acetylglutamate kinase [Candidatus Omnitrophica bacterium]|nr:acetylglutamate kinase [Candidatus Omnitrophota bacterium]
MRRIIEKADILIEALPYIRVFRRKAFVIKYGGQAMMSDKRRRSILQDLVFLSSVGISPILVHGGGPQINERLKASGKVAHFVEGRRVTDAETARVVEGALDELNQQLVREIREELKGHAKGISGKQGLFSVKRISKKELGFVGEIVKVEKAMIEKLLEDSTVPVVSPVSRGGDGKLYNVNADEAATKLAEALRAEKLVFLTDVNGILRNRHDPTSRIPTVKLSEVDGLISRRIIEEGMIPKIKAAVHAISRGVKKVHIINGSLPRALLLEIFTDKGIGTEIVR